jgi:hypothetical protein
MTNILELRAELRKLGPADLLKMAFNQKEHHCILSPNGSCSCYFKYKGFGFCVSELSGQGCQEEKAIEEKIQKPLDFCEKAGPLVDLSVPYQGEIFTITRTEAKTRTQRY